MPLSKNDLLRLLLAERGPLLGFLMAIGRDRDLAEDVFQTVAVILSDKQPVVETREQFLAWARTTARYALNNARRKQRRTLVLSDDVLDVIERDWTRSDRHAGSAQAEALEACMRLLSANVRHLVHLRYDRGLSTEELARVLDRKVNSIHAALSRAYRTLGNCIESRIQGRGGA